MKYCLNILCFFILSTTMLIAQQATAPIIVDLNTVKTGQGKVVIYQDEAIEGLLGTRKITPQVTPQNQSTTSNGTSNDAEQKNTNRNFVRARGYRIQVYSGNDQKKSRQEAYAKKEMIVSNSPDIDVNITFNSPVWRVRVGNYRTYEQAFAALKELKNKFPSFGREMHIVEDVIKLYVD